MYGISNYTLFPPLSALVAIVMCLGITFIGFITINYTKINILFKAFHYKNFFSPLVGSYIIIFSIFPFLSLGLLNKELFISISLIIFILGIIFIFFLIKKFNSNLLMTSYKKFNKLDLILTALFFFSLFLLSISPITHADALASHVVTSIEILNKGTFSTNFLSLKNLLISGGEIFIILGFALKSQELGNLIQYLSILSLLPIFLSIKNNVDISKLVPVLGILSSFCMIFLVSSPKPQMLHIMGSLFVFSFICNYLHLINKKNFFLISFTLTSILIINIQAKFSFVLGSVLLISFFCIYSINKSLFKKYIFVLFLLFFILVFPSFIFRYNYFNTDIINLFLSPLPLNIYGFIEYQNSIVNQSAYGVFPLWLIIPNELKNFSSVIGPIVFIIFLVSKKNIADKRYYFFGLALYFILAINYGQPSARFIFEGFICFVYLIFICNLKVYKHVKIFFNLIRLQSVFLIIIICLFVFWVFPGSLNKNLYDSVMHKTANGYSLIKWANTKLSKESIVLSMHDSISFFNVKSFNHYFLDVVDFKNPQSQIFTKKIKDSNINTVLFYGRINKDNLKKDPYYDKLENCIGKLIAHKKDVGRHVGRNPFQKGALYDAWIFEFNLKKFPSCLK